MKKIFIMVALLFVVITLSACDRNDSNGETGGSELVGTWVYEEFSDWIYIFYDDGTGRRGLVDSGVYGIHGEASFEWESEDGNLDIDCSVGLFGDHFNPDKWTYTIEGDTLILESRQERGLVYRYTRQ